MIYRHTTSWQADLQHPLTVSPPLLSFPPPPLFSSSECACPHQWANRGCLRERQLTALLHLHSLAGAYTHTHTRYAHTRWYKHSVILADHFKLDPLVNTTWSPAWGNYWYFVYTKYVDTNCPTPHVYSGRPFCCLLSHVLNELHTFHCSSFSNTYKRLLMPYLPLVY